MKCPTREKLVSKLAGQGPNEPTLTIMSALEIREKKRRIDGDEIVCLIPVWFGLYILTLVRAWEA